MNVPSLQDNLRQKHLSSATRRPARRRPRLHVESLEAREVPATVPTVLSVNPATGQEFTNGIIVNFSENVNGAGTPANYRLFAQDGRTFPFTVTYDGTAHTATITPTGTLPAGTYSLFIQGDQITDTDGDNLRVAQAGRLVLANNGTGGGNLTTVPMTPTGLGAGTAVPLALNRNPRAAVAGDLNADGILDLVAPVSTNNEVQVFLGTAAGGYSAPTRLLLPAGTGPVSAAIGDVTGDGIPDIVTANSAGDSVAVFRNLGAGTFAAPAFTTVGSAPTDLVLADFNGDGSLDVAVSHNGNRPARRGVTVLLNTGMGTFGPANEFLTTVRAGAIVAADFNRDGNVDLAVTENFSIGTVRVLRGTGNGSFTPFGTLSVGALPTDLVVADFNADGFTDIATVSGSATTSRDVSVILNSAGAGFRTALHTTVPGLVDPFTGKKPLQSLAVVYGNQDPYPDLVLTTQAPVPPPAFPAAPTTNVEVLTGIGDGSFVPFQAGFALRGGAAGNQPSFVSVVSDPFRRLTAFDVKSANVRVDLVRNGNFQSRALDGSQGSLDGWSVFKLRDATTGSRGAWAIQSGTGSPLSGILLNQAAWPKGLIAWPTGPAGATGPNGPQGFQAMLDEQHLIPVIPGNPDPNPPSNYEGSHALYQDITIPAGFTAKLSLRLSLLSAAPWSNTGDNTTLDYRTSLPNQQVRVDILRVVQGADPLDVGANVLLNVFTTTPSDPTQQTLPITDVDLSAFAGQTIRIRIAAANNQGQLIVGVDDVKVEALGADTENPDVGGLSLRNPTFVPGPGGAQQSTDPTITGSVTDNGSINNVVKLV
ncbi:MAG TPA: FG-GAP-like repeat-containing protein, partial [Gemmataceae bacterium]|nr:FG-GAP-like repeat-containing protein [Gemmataceae bacterium]